MSRLTACSDPISFDDLATQIRKSSNFRFTWQFYRCGGTALWSPKDVREMLDSIIAMPDLHRFLRESFAPSGEDTFQIEPLHEHCKVDIAPVENILASAAADELGAYSQKKWLSTYGAKKKKIGDLLRTLGEHTSYQLLPGAVPDCAVCRRYNHHLFTTWFYGVAWDWCFFVSWAERDLLWMGCLTDTD